MSLGTCSLAVLLSRAQFHHRQCLCLSLQVATVRTGAAAVMAPVVTPDMTDEQRAVLAKELGYKCIGKELPDGVSLTDIVKSMPPEVSADLRLAFYETLGMCTWYHHDLKMCHATITSSGRPDPTLQHSASSVAT
jgi:hypothetical protein